MNKKKWRSQLATELPRNGIHHPSRVNNSVEPERPRHLFFRQVRRGHVDHDLPVQFHEAIRQLATRCRSDNVGGIVDKMFPNLYPKKFGITIALETPSI